MPWRVTCLFWSLKPDPLSMNAPAQRAMRRIFQISSGSAYPVFSFLVLSFARKIHVDNRRDPTQAGSLCYDWPDNSQRITIETSGVCFCPGSPGVFLADS